MHTQDFFCYDTIEAFPWGKYSDYSKACLVVYNGDYSGKPNGDYGKPTYSYDKKVRRIPLCSLSYWICCFLYGSAGLTGHLN